MLVLALVFVAGKEILRFESNLIAGVTACSNMSWAILSPLDIYLDVEGKDRSGDVW